MRPTRSAGEPERLQGGASDRTNRTRAPAGASSYSVAFLLNWPLAVFVLLVASTVLAIAQSGVGSPTFWIGLTLAIIASAELLVLSRWASATGPVVERALDEGLGPDWLHGFDLFGSRRFDIVIDGIEAFTAYVLSRHPGADL